MPGQIESPDFAELNREAIERWEQIAPWWDEYIWAEGNDYHKDFIGPAQERLLGLKEDQTVLGVACGNGQFARRMAELGARVVAFDATRAFLERAVARMIQHADRIEYHHIDATDPDQVMGLGERRFDAAVSTMALMDISDIGPLVRSLSRLLRIGAPFVFSVTHPCFNTGSTKLVAEQEVLDGEFAAAHSVKISEYITPKASKAIGIRNQPVPHYYFDRPISVLFNTFFDAGLVLDGIEEPGAYEEAHAEKLFSWSNHKDIPSALVARMRLMPG